MLLYGGFSCNKVDEARRGGTLEKLFESIDRAELVILDKWGYFSLEKERYNFSSSLF